MSVASLVGSIAITQGIRRHVDALWPVRLGRILVMAQVVVVGGIVVGGIVVGGIVVFALAGEFWIAARALSHLRR